ncbi:hypothetical protein KQI15_14665 [Intestinimonas butyriciproducens]|uniref:hypothetical protein n=1 Tax=Intestinimonas butyriciproducens TaxID=1297617 RepID=UPI001C129476|nr:hypothetical protein [Intestinimonas butyriciproducens]MBU5231250.1 hypothetical protein [Intestinimonas butyriciproducens]
MKKKPAAGLMRHAIVDGKEKYARIAIRRRRTPLYAFELVGVLNEYMTPEGLDIEAMRTAATEIFAQEHPDYEYGGMILSALDFARVFNLRRGSFQAADLALTIEGRSVCDRNKKAAPQAGDGN